MLNHVTSLETMFENLNIVTVLLTDLNAREFCTPITQITVTVAL
jgi:hypothetical protein